MAHPQYNLSLPEAIKVLHEQEEKNRKQTQDGIKTEGLEGMSVDEAYDIGYATLLHDLESLTGPDPFEVHAVIATEDGLVDLGQVPNPMNTEEKN